MSDERTNADSWSEQVAGLFHEHREEARTKLSEAAGAVLALSGYLDEETARSFLDDFCSLVGLMGTVGEAERTTSHTPWRSAISHLGLDESLPNGSSC